MNTIRQNFLLPKKVKNLLDDAVPKGKQSQFVAEAIEERIVSEKSWKILESPALLNSKNPLLKARKIRRNWKRK